MTKSCSLGGLGGIGRSDQEWGYVESVYDARSNISSINIVYKA